MIWLWLKTTCTQVALYGRPHDWPLSGRGCRAARGNAAVVAPASLPRRAFEAAFHMAGRAMTL